ncbi:MAG: hypothetical protein PHY28_09800, partial [Dehalococcoidales bacterium]|nr:hypothetical protein [Dehalococcoidales bacterium]
ESRSEPVAFLGQESPARTGLLASERLVVNSLAQLLLPVVVAVQLEQLPDKRVAEAEVELLVEEEADRERLAASLLFPAAPGGFRP